MLPNPDIKPRLWILLALGGIMEILFLLYRLIPTNPANSVIKYMVIYVALFLVLIAAYLLLRRQPLTPVFLITILIFTFIFGMTLLPSAPDQSDDIYRYVWDGKLQYYHFSPYTYAPDDPVLKPYHSDTLPRLVNFPHIKTIYPPVAQLVFRLSYTLFGESVSGLKFFFLLALLGSIIFFYKILKRHNVSPDSGSGHAPLLLFFAWNPLVVMEVAINGHLDILMVFFLSMFLYYFFSKRLIVSGIGMGLAILSKLIPIILAPLVLFYFIFKNQPQLLLHATGWPRLIKSGWTHVWRFFLPMTLTVAGFYVLYFESARNMFLTAFNYGTKWYFNNPLFMILLSLFDDNRIAHYVSFSLFVLLYAVILTRKIPIQQKFFYTFFAFTFMNPALHPWYLTVLLAFLAIHRSMFVMCWSGTVIAAYIVVYQFKLTGQWQDSWLIMAIEYIPLVLLTMAIDFQPWTTCRDVIYRVRRFLS